jgi:hypothetical protein
VTVEGEPAAVVVVVAEVPEKAVLVMVALTWVWSPAKLLGCHEVVTTPPELVTPELGVNVVVNPVVG